MSICVGLHGNSLVIGVQSWIDSDSAGDVTNELVFVSLLHRFVVVVLSKERHVATFQDRNANSVQKLSA